MNFDKQLIGQSPAIYVEKSFRNYLNSICNNSVMDLYVEMLKANNS